MAGIFVSYRRGDTSGEAGRLASDLRRRFGGDRVFVDVTGIQKGVDFREEINRALKTCDVLLAVIGRDWLSVQLDGKRRLEGESDPVRVEIIAALERNIRVIPVLVKGAEMPKPEDLPQDLEPLAWRAAAELRHERWDSDFKSLADDLKRVVRSSPGWRRKLTVLTSAGVVAAAAIVFGVCFSQSDIKTPSVLGMPVEQARRVLHESGLLPGEERKILSAEPSGTVLVQIPAPGARIPKGAAVTLTYAISQSPSDPTPKPSTPDATTNVPTVTIPNVVGNSQAVARALLVGKLGLKIQASHEVSDVAAHDTVLHQSPSAGVNVPSGSVVKLVLADASVVVPDVVGKVAMDAQAELRAAHLNDVTTEQRDADAKPGTVIAQDPAASTKVARTRSVRLIVAAPTEKPGPKPATPGEKPGPKPITVPNVVCKPDIAATQAIYSIGLRAEIHLSKEKSPCGGPGTVLSQTPTAGDNVEPGTVISLVVYR
jgi:beta-lactam-binding protein with PASTA domain